MLGLSFRTWFFVAIAAVWAYYGFIRTPTNAMVATRNGQYAITELEPFDATLRVLSKESYHLGRESDLSPMDIAVGWGVMADPKIYSRFQITQSGRWYYWQANPLPIARREVETHSSNIHLVPATPYVADRLRRIGREDLIRVRGSLIEVRAPDGWRWKSSLSREDTGDGACELLLLKQIDWVTTTATKN